MSNPFINGSYSNESVNNGSGEEVRDRHSVELDSATNQTAEPQRSSWVKFDSQQSNASTTNDDQNERRGDDEVKKQPNEPTTTATDYATIELTNSIEISHSPSKQINVNSTPLAANNPAQLPITTTPKSSAIPSGGTSSSSTIATAPSHTSATNGGSHFANGDIIVNLLPLNDDSCAWVTPAKFKAHLVPEELMAQSLTLTVEDYVSTMSTLFNDYRFNFYIIFYKRVLGLWITIGVLVLLAILFSGWKGMPMFVGGMLWLIINALGIFLAIFVKQRLNRMLEQAIAQVNAVFSKHNIFLGVDDRGRYSCHKVNLVFVYFDAKYCVKFLQDMLNNAEPQSTDTTRIGKNSLVNFTLNSLQNIDTSDIIITGSTPRNISQKEKYAEKLLLRYSQRWIREFNRDRIELNPPPPTAPANGNQTTTTGMMNNQQPHPQPSTATNNRAAITAIPMSSRHCRTSRCFCQYIEEHLKYKPVTRLFNFGDMFSLI